MEVKSSISSCFSFLRFLIILSVPLAIEGVVVASYMHYLPYKVPIHTLVTISVIFFIFLLFIPHNAYYSSCKIINSFKTMKEELKEKIRATFLKINGEKKSTLKIDNFLKEYFKDIRNDNFASLATTIFPMLGILGTFISIAISMPDFSVSSTEALDRDISALLGGVGTAFYASIYGIFLSIWWMFFEKRGLSRIDRYSTLVKKDFSKYIWDEMTLNHYMIAQNQMHNEELVDSLRESFNIHFMKKFNDSYIQSYSKLMEETKSSFEHINKDIKEAASLISSTLYDVSNTDKNVRFAKELDKKMDDFQKVISSLDDTLDKTFHKIDSEVADIVTKLADFAEVVVQKSDDVERSLQNYHQQVKRLIKD